MNGARVARGVLQHSILSRRACQSRCILPLLLAVLAFAPKLLGQEQAYVDAENYPAAIATVGKFVYVATSVDGGHSGDVCAYRINPQTGLLAPIGKWPAAKSNVANVVAADPKGRFVYVGGGPYQPIAEFAIDASSGALTPVGTVMAGGQVRQIAMDPNGNFAYVLTVVNSVTTIISHRIEPSGALTVVGTPLPIGNLTPPEGMTIDPRGRLAYIVNGTAVASFRIDPSTGAISMMGGVTDPTGTSFWGAGISPNGKYLLLVDVDVGVVQALSINPDTGAFALVGKPQAVTGMGGGARTLTFDPSGKYVYVTTGGDISAYTMNAASGELKLIGDILPTYGGADRAVIDQTGQYLYVTGQNIRTVLGFRLDHATGELTRLGTPEVPAFVPVGMQQWVPLLMANRGGPLIDPNLLPPSNRYDQDPKGTMPEWSYGADPTHPDRIRKGDAEYEYLGQAQQSSLLLNKKDGRIYKCCDISPLQMIAANIADIPIPILKIVTNPSADLRVAFLKAEDHGEGAHVTKGADGKYTLTYRLVQGGVPGAVISDEVVKMPDDRVKQVVPVGQPADLWVWTNKEGRPGLPAIFDLQPQGVATWIPVTPDVAQAMTHSAP